MFGAWYWSARYFAARFWRAAAELVVLPPTPPERVVFVDAELRTFIVPAEIRMFQVPAETRTSTAPAETRTDSVPAENRTSTGSE